MKPFYIGIGLIILGLSLFALSAYMGESGFALFLIFPVFYSSGIFGFLAILLIFIGFFLIFLSPFWSVQKIAMHEYVYYPESRRENFEKRTDKKVEKKFGGVLLIGPIPIVFGSDKNMAIVSILATILLLIVVTIILLIL